MVLPLPGYAQPNRRYRYKVQVKSMEPLRLSRWKTRLGIVGVGGTRGICNSTGKWWFSECLASCRVFISGVAVWMTKNLCLSDTLGGGGGVSRLRRDVYHQGMDQRWIYMSQDLVRTGAPPISNWPGGEWLYWKYPLQNNQFVKGK